MIIFKQPTDIHSFLLKKKNEKLVTGFVPTMGALHAGHIALIKKAQLENDLVICSIFVNPTQFNDTRDFEKYPITIEKDIFSLEKAGCDVLFLPTVIAIYPSGVNRSTNYNLGYLETIMEGKFRPGHFQGVCQVVRRLLEITIADRLYLGQKDFQQCLVIKKMIADFHIDTKTVICDTQREANGLAMSSRNKRLVETERESAAAIHSALLYIKGAAKEKSINQLKEDATAQLTKKGFKVDYVEIATTDKLEALTMWDGKTSAVALIAAFLGEVRLIDNLIL
jgi:pantoate--beta-alanine ligase